MDPRTLDADVLLLDAGNTLVFLDADVAATTLQDAGLALPAGALAAAMGAAHRGYADRLATGASHVSRKRKSSPRPRYRRNAAASV